MLLSTSTSAEIQTVYFRMLQQCGTVLPVWSTTVVFFCSPSETHFYDWKIFKVCPCLNATKQTKVDILEQYFSSHTLCPSCVCSTGRQNKFLSRGGRTGVAMAACKPQLNECTHSWVANFYCRPRLSLMNMSGRMSEQLGVRAPQDIERNCKVNTFNLNEELPVWRLSLSAIQQKQSNSPK